MTRSIIRWQVHAFSSVWDTIATSGGSTGSYYRLERWDCEAFAQYIRRAPVLVFVYFMRLYDRHVYTGKRFCDLAL